MTKERAASRTATGARDAQFNEPRLSRNLAYGVDGPDRHELGARQQVAIAWTLAFCRNGRHRPRAQADQVDGFIGALDFRLDAAGRVTHNDIIESRVIGNVAFSGTSLAVTFRR